MATITNLQVEVISSGVGAPYGPITLVSDLTDFPTPNENHSIEFTTALGDTVFMSYEQLIDSDVRLRLLEQSAGVQFRVQEIKDAVATMYAVTNAFSVPHTYGDLTDAIAVIRANKRFLEGYF